MANAKHKKAISESGKELLIKYYLVHIESVDFNVNVFMFWFGAGLSFYLNQILKIMLLIFVKISFFIFFSFK